LADKHVTFMPSPADTSDPSNALQAIQADQ